MNLNFAAGTKPMCDCAEKIYQKMNDQLDIEDLTLSFTYVSFVDGSTKVKLPLTYREKGKKKIEKSFLIANYCPFCGKEYEEYTNE